MGGIKTPPCTCDYMSVTSLYYTERITLKTSRESREVDMTWSSWEVLYGLDYIIPYDEIKPLRRIVKHKFIK
jgi:hypothetical protein